MKKNLKKYNIPGPRYTSYPTVPAWSDTVTPNDYKKSLQKINPNDPVSLYFHIPFCENQCHFCGCSRVQTKDHQLSSQYIETLIKEIELVTSLTKNPHPNVSQLHLGGGSPNFLYPEELSLLITKVKKQFNILENAEVAVEINPKHTSIEFCNALKNNGFNRISLGIQDFDERVQKLINRNQSYKETIELINYLKQLQITHFNFDLIYGLPGQTKKSFLKTLERLLKLSPNRLALYSYAHIPWIQEKQRSFTQTDLPSPQLKRDLFEMALTKLTHNGYQLIGLDHFAREDDELFLALQNKSIHRNFMGYSTRANAHQIGFGATSISYVNENYFQNNKNTQTYMSQIHTNKLTTTKGHVLSEDDKIRRALINELMCHLEIDINELENKYSFAFHDYFNRELKALKTFETENLVQTTPTKISVTNEGHLVLRNMAMCFDSYLENLQKKSSSPVFSRTI